MLKILYKFAEWAAHYFITLKNVIYTDCKHVWQLATLKECLPTLIKLAGNNNYSENDKTLIWSTLLLINSVLFSSATDNALKEFSLKSNKVNDSNFTREIIRVGNIIREKKYAIPAGLLSEFTKSDLRLINNNEKLIVNLNSNNSIVNWVEEEYIKLLTECEK